MYQITSADLVVITNQSNTNCGIDLVIGSASDFNFSSGIWCHFTIQKTGSGYGYQGLY
jgi:hypothetical protein